jgi:ABC-type transport system involved in multi-copper enzyme maturation permease subunit
MTAPTLTPPPRTPTHSQHPAFSRTLRAEWTKLRTVRGWVIGMLAGGLLIVFVGVFLASNASIGCGPTLTGAACLPKVPTGPGGQAVTDSYYLVHRPLTGNGSITVRVTSLAEYVANGDGRAAVGQGPSGANLSKGVVPWAKAGILIEASTRQGSAYAAMMVTGSHGVRMQWNYVYDTPGATGAVTEAAPRWLRLTRTGSSVTGYDSADGIHWTKVGTVRLAGLSPTVQSGLFVTSPLSAKATPFFGGASIQTAPSQSTAVFDSVTLGGAWPAATWSGDNIGQGRISPGTGAGGFTQSNGRFTVTGSGDIAPLVGGPGSGGIPSTSVQQPLMGIFIGLIAVVVVGAAFFTSEYRRGLIRVTLAASPRRGRVLAAKAVVAGGVAFVVGLAAALVAVWIGLPRERAQGQYVMPVSALTDVRVIVGTAAIAAVAAVLAVALGAILRRSAAAITAVIVVVVLPFLLAVAVLPQGGAAEWLLRVTPAAGFAVQQSLPQYAQVDALYPIAAGYYPLAPWAGFAVLCAWTALALGLALFLLRRRDA